MNVVQLPNVGRRAFCLSVVGLLAFAGGCGDATNTPAAAPEDTKAKEEAERAAREKAFGPGGLPGKTKAKHKG